MRNDSALYTGMNSSTAQKLERVELKDKARKDEKTQTRAKILPAVEVFNEEIDKETKRVILAQLDLIDKDGDINAEAKALKLYKASMATLKSRVSNIMREPKEKKK
jgi:hypothetical protein